MLEKEDSLESENLTKEDLAISKIGYSPIYHSTAIQILEMTNLKL